MMVKKTRKCFKKFLNWYFERIDENNTFYF